MAAANGLLKQMTDFRLILSLHIIQDILAITGPCMLQNISGRLNGPGGCGNNSENKRVFVASQKGG
jgi:hypothetical protein